MASRINPDDSWASEQDLNIGHYCPFTLSKNTSNHPQRKARFLENPSHKARLSTRALPQCQWLRQTILARGLFSGNHVIWIFHLKIILPVMILEVKPRSGGITLIAYAWASERQTYLLIQHSKTHKLPGILMILLKLKFLSVKLLSPTSLRKIPFELSSSQRGHEEKCWV